MRAGKRERLVAGAREVIHHQDVEKTTIADIAGAADVPVGNVYYYFKTKDELVEAAIDGYATCSSAARLARAPSHATGAPTGLVRALTEQRDLAAEYGCPMGSLCSELDKRAEPLGCRHLLELPIEWADCQFRLLGRRDARDLTVALIASYHGIALLTNTFRDPELMARQARRLERWIDSLA